MKGLNVVCGQADTCCVRVIVAYERACMCARVCGSISLHYSPPVSYRLKKMLNDCVVLKDFNPIICGS